MLSAIQNTLRCPNPRVRAGQATEGPHELLPQNVPRELAEPDVAVQPHHMRAVARLSRLPEVVGEAPDVRELATAYRASDHARSRRVTRPSSVPAIENRTS